jgi:hypothetical protein
MSPSPQSEIVDRSANSEKRYARRRMRDEYDLIASLLRRGAIPDNRWGDPSTLFTVPFADFEDALAEYSPASLAKVRYVHIFTLYVLVSGV